MISQFRFPSLVWVHTDVVTGVDAFIGCPDAFAEVTLITSFGRSVVERVSEGTVQPPPTTQKSTSPRGGSGNESGRGGRQEQRRAHVVTERTIDTPRAKRGDRRIHGGVARTVSAHFGSPRERPGRGREPIHHTGAKERPRRRHAEWLLIRNHHPHAEQPPNGQGLHCNHGTVQKTQTKGRTLDSGIIPRREP